jgi:hypothetical protein
MECCQCGNVANNQFQFPIGIRELKTGNNGNWQHLKWPPGEAQPVTAIDFGPETVGGYAAFEVDAFEPAPDGTLPVLRLSYACHPDSVRPEGDFTREEHAYYLHVDNPVLPANPGRFELYTIPRTGTFVAPLIQGQLRYLRVALETPGTAVTLSNLRIANPGVHAETPPRGSFACADKRMEAVWRLGVRSCQMASLTNPDAWRIVEGMLLPRRLERGAAEGWCRFVPDFEGTLELKVEFRRNPHYDGPAFFEVFTGRRDAEPAVRETVRQEGPDGEIRTIRIPLKPGRFGFRLEKEQWPVIHEVVVRDASGNVRWQDDFCSGGMACRRHLGEGRLGGLENPIPAPMPAAQNTEEMEKGRHGVNLIESLHVPAPPSSFCASESNPPTLQNSKTPRSESNINSASLPLCASALKTLGSSGRKVWKVWNV